MDDNDHIFRSKTNRVFKGCLGGFGEYAGIDPVIIRIIYCFYSIVVGVIPGLVGYLILILCIPEQPL